MDREVEWTKGREWCSWFNCGHRSRPFVHALCSIRHCYYSFRHRRALVVAETLLGGFFAVMLVGVGWTAAEWTRNPQGLYRPLCCGPVGCGDRRNLMNIATFICIIGGFVAGVGGYGVKRNHDARKKAAKDVVEKGDRR